jgi:hypothetical protein
MKQEPEWIDVLAMIAMHSFLQSAPKNARPEEIAYAAYQQAEAMMKEKERLNDFE